MVPSFDFAEALPLSMDERFVRSVRRAEQILEMNSYQDLTDAPCIPGPATDQEIRALQRELEGEMPAEYASFLRRHRYLLLDDGWQIGGFDHEGVHHASPPWLSNEHSPPRTFIVVADYWMYADGDQLLLSPEGEAFVYLHEHGPLIEPFAPSFSLAVWRLVFEER